MSFIPFLQAAAPATSGSLLMAVLPFGLIILIFYIIINRPHNKKQKETDKMIAALKKGDKVVTFGGIYGVVSSTRESTVIVKVDDGTKIEFARTAISSVITDKSEKSAKADTSKTESVKADEEKKEESTQTNSEENK